MASTVISHGITIEGELTTDDDVVIEGTLRGKLVSKDTVKVETGAVVEADISAREYQAEKPETDELRTPYLEDGQLDLTGWARDALVLELPEKILCREDCAGLCPVCGLDLNDSPHVHEDDEPDSRWAALSELREKL
jgi:uncharacterized metal-binding protein YceD (DUF177 family)